LIKAALDMTFGEPLVELMIELFGVLVNLIGLAALTGLGAFLAAYLADDYQTKGKIKELRFRAFQEASKRYHELLSVAWQRSIARVHQVTVMSVALAPGGQDVNMKASEAEFTRRENAYSVAYVEAASLIPELSVLYGRDDGELWAGLMGHFLKYRRARLLVDQHDALLETERAWATFVNAVAPKLYLEHQGLAVQVPETFRDEEQLRARLAPLDKWLQENPMILPNES